MTAEGALYFIIMIGSIVSLIGVGVEVLTLFAKNPKVKYIPIVITGALFLMTGISNGHFKESSTILFGILTLEETLVLLGYLIIKKLRKKK